MAWEGRDSNSHLLLCLLFFFCPCFAACVCVHLCSLLLVYKAKRSNFELPSQLSHTQTNKHNTQKIHTNTIHWLTYIFNFFHIEGKLINPWVWEGRDSNSHLLLCLLFFFCPCFAACVCVHLCSLLLCIKPNVLTLNYPPCLTPFVSPTKRCRLIFAFNIFNILPDQLPLARPCYDLALITNSSVFNKLFLLIILI